MSVVPSLPPRPVQFSPSDVAWLSPPRQTPFKQRNGTINSPTVPVMSDASSRTPQRSSSVINVAVEMMDAVLRERRIRRSAADLSVVASVEHHPAAANDTPPAIAAATATECRLERRDEAGIDTARRPAADAMIASLQLDTVILEAALYVSEWLRGPQAELMRRRITESRRRRVRPAESEGSEDDPFQFGVKRDGDRSPITQPRPPGNALQRQL